MLETALYSRIRPKLQAWGEVSRVENSIESGMPDVFFMCGGQYNWIETKVDHAGELYYERFQPGWHRRYIRAGATNLFCMTSVEGSRSCEMNVYHMADLVKAPFTHRGKWYIFRTEDLTPILTMRKTYDWDPLRLLLSKPFTPQV